ncbi:MAG: ATPase, T2SS/T4P/T4SS family [Candidatus Micrarchaeota archaeon]|nr:ATPase, T2SS/T4P/T4SS family [Candidatus Micrarchaeota archaeon]
MGSIGWGIGDWKSDYKLNLPKLSEEEKEVILEAAERFRQETQRKEISKPDEAREIAKEILLSACESMGFDLEPDQKDYLSEVLFLQTWGAGFLEELLADESLEEIAVIGLGRPVFVFVRGKGWKKTNAMIDSQDYFVSLVNRLGRNLGRRLTQQSPRMNAVLEDGSRLHASMPPVSGCELTIRKFSREPFSPFDLLSFGTYDAKTLALLSLAVQADLSVVVAGNTASGKTSTLNSLLLFVPSSERVLIIEETPEISLPHPHQMRLLPFEEGGISMVELVRDSLRMRPDRVVVGEVRSAQETRAFVESALSGQAKGCYSTFHAQSSRDALLRMRMMGCLEADLEGIDLFVVQRRVSVYERAKRRAGEKRQVVEIAISDRSNVMHPKAVFNGRAFSPSALSAMIERISSGTSMSIAEVKREIKSREKFIRDFASIKGFEKAFNSIQKFLYGG